MRVSIMQPYFFPYAGYYRLFTAVDMFVVLDCVQFPRRGWVHRNKLKNSNGELQWLTLPLIKSNRDTTRICDLRFQEDAFNLFEDQRRKFPFLNDIENSGSELSEILMDFDVSPVQYLVRSLKWVTEKLNISKPIMLSSTLNIPEHFKAQDRILEIAKRVEATEYVNAPGGRELYDLESFRSSGLNLEFLQDYSGSYESMLQRLLNEEVTVVKEEILNNTVTSE